MQEIMLPERWKSLFYKRKKTLKEKKVIYMYVFSVGVCVYIYNICVGIYTDI